MSSKDNFAEFQKFEYERIAEAHFKTIDAISSFFRYYLIIMSLPATAAALLLSREDTGSGKESGSWYLSISLTPTLEMMLGLTLIIVAAIGFCLMLYVVNLRMDVILYARTVNAIRKYFYDAKEIPLPAKQQLRVLPQTRYLPSYNEPRYFWPVVFTFAFLNVSYFVAGFALWSHANTQEYLPSALFLSWIAIALFFVLHLSAYRSYARIREHGYLETSAIGVDIDGVLNLHRDQFCKILFARTGITITPDQILHMPVRKNAGLGVTSDHETDVFHVPAYWSEMPAMAGAADILKKLRKELGLKVHVFSHRPWPVPTKSDINLVEWASELDKLQAVTKISGSPRKLSESLRAIFKSWRVMFLSIRREWEIQSRSLRDRWLALLRWFYVRLPWVHFIDRMTHLWLYKHSMQYDRLIIEKGHTNLANPNARLVNRFNIARRNSLRFFVEDDLEKAIKLAHICDVVFLIDHPYNRAEDLAANIVRVDSWDDIYDKVKALS